MAFITPLDSILLPLFLVCFIFCIASVLLYMPKYQLQSISKEETGVQPNQQSDTLETTDLEKFYQAVNNDPILYEQFESLINQKDFLRQIVQLGVRLGYTFTDSEVKNSIEDCTASGQGEYFCLPIGCWHKA